jgi:hypothetical protein
MGHTRRTGQKSLSRLLRGKSGRARKYRRRYTRAIAKPQPSKYTKSGRAAMRKQQEYSRKMRRLWGMPSRKVKVKTANGYAMVNNNMIEEAIERVKATPAATRFSARRRGIAPAPINLPASRRSAKPRSSSYVPVGSPANDAHTVRNPVPAVPLGARPPLSAINENNNNSNNNMGDFIKAFEKGTKL